MQGDRVWYQIGLDWIKDWWASVEVRTRLSTKMWGMSPELQFLQKNQYYVYPFLNPVSTMRISSTEDVHS